MSTAAPPVDLAPPTPAGFLSRYGREVSVAVAYAVLLLLLAIWGARHPNQPSFFRNQFADTWVRAAPLLVAAVGMTLVILSRQIDISIGSQFSVCGMVTGVCVANHVPLPLTLAATLAAGAVMGAANGALIGGMGLPSIVVTLATMVVLRGSLLWITQGAAAYLPDTFQWFGLSQLAGQIVLLATALVVFVAFAWALRWLAAGRTVYAVGSDQEAARLTVARRRIVFTVFTLMGVLTGLAALLNCTRFAIVYPNYGDGLELQVIAAVVVGGTAISGGRGTITGTLLGVVLLATIGPALVFLGAKPQWERAIQGLIILAAVASDSLQRRRS